MKSFVLTPLLMSIALFASATTATAQDTNIETETETALEDAAESPWLKVYFDTGSTRISSEQIATLDRAVRTFREGDPFVMVVAGGADKVGDPNENLQLSLERATAVALALTNRGIPIERLQVLGRGNSELEVVTPAGVPEAENRVVEISWR